MLLVKLFSNEIDITLSEGDYHHNRAGLFQSVEDLEMKKTEVSEKEGILPADRFQTQVVT